MTTLSSSTSAAALPQGIVSQPALAGTTQASTAATTAFSFADAVVAAVAAGLDGQTSASTAAASTADAGRRATSAVATGSPAQSSLSRPATGVAASTERPATLVDPKKGLAHVATDGVKQRVGNISGAVEVKTESAVASPVPEEQVAPGQSSKSAKDAPTAVRMESAPGRVDLPELSEAPVTAEVVQAGPQRRAESRLQTHHVSKTEKAPTTAQDAAPDVTEATQPTSSTVVTAPQMNAAAVASVPAMQQAAPHKAVRALAPVEAATPAGMPSTVPTVSTKTNATEPTATDTSDKSSPDDHTEARLGNVNAPDHSVPISQATAVAVAPIAQAMNAAPRANARDVQSPELGANGMAPQTSGAAALAPEVAIHRYELPSANALEVTVSAGKLGAIHVTAQLADDGSVTTRLQSAPATAATLHAESANLSSFLAEQAIPVRHVVVETWKTPTANAVADGATSQGETAGQGQRDRDEHNGQTSRPGVRTGRLPSTDAPGFLSESTGTTAGSGTVLATSGGWVSVRV